MSTLPPPLPPPSVDPGALPPPPLAYAVPSPDDGHLRLLAIFHYIWGGLAAAASSVALIHVGLGIWMIANPNAFASPAQPGPPPFVGWMFLGIGGAVVLLGWALGGLTIYSGRCIAGRQHHTFSLVMAGISCLSVPIGTALGVFTFVVLLRPTVRAQYDPATVTRA